MVYARPKIAADAQRLAGARRSTIPRREDVKGYIRASCSRIRPSTVPGWVMVFADSYPAAIRAADCVKVEWTAGTAANVSEQDMLDHGAKQIADPNGGVVRSSTTRASTRLSVRRIDARATYTTGSVLHFQLEPVNALAFEKDGIFEIHTGNQWQSLDPARAGEGARRAAGAHRHA